jgi:hypothetical protein
MLRRVVLQKFTDVACRALMKEATNSETYVNYQTTRRNIPEDSQLHNRRRENLKFHPQFKFCGHISQSVILLFYARINTVQIITL